MDTLLQNVNTGVLLSPPKSTNASDTPGITLENMGLRYVVQTVADTSGTVILPNAGGTGSVRYWGLGPIYKNAVRSWIAGNASEYPREASLISDFGQAGPPMLK